jgi:hypothetical protein
MIDEKTVDVMTDEVKKHLLQGADRIVLDVDKSDSGEDIIFCRPEYNLPPIIKI